MAFLFSGGYSTQMYQLNQIHVTGISIYDLERVTDPTNALHSQLAIFNQYNITYLGFNTTKAPFNDARVRRAFCHAVDKDRVASQVLLDSVDAARGIVPPGMMGYDAGFEGWPTMWIPPRPCWLRQATARAGIRSGWWSRFRGAAAR